MRSRAILFLILSITSLVLGEMAIRYQKPAAFHALNEFWLGFSLAATGADVHASAVTTIRINEDYEPLALQGDQPANQPTELTRLDYATILQFLSHLQPAAVGFVPSPVFSEADVFNQTDITPLREVAMRLPKMTAGTRLRYSGDEQQPAFVNAPLPTIASTGDLKDVPMVNRLDASLEPQILANAVVGFTEITDTPATPEGDAYLRIPLVAKSEKGLLPSFLVLAIAQHAGVPLDEIQADLTSPNDKTLSIGSELVIPIEADGSFLLPLINPFTKEIVRQEEGATAGEITISHPFTSLTATELAYTGKGSETVLQQVAEKYATRFQSIEDNLVLLGFDQAGDRTLPLYAGEQGSYLTALAQAAAVIQSGLHLREMSLPARASLSLVLILSGVFLLQFIQRKVFIFSVLLLIAFWSAVLIIFGQTLHWLYPFTPLVISVALIIGCMMRKQLPAAETGSSNPTAKGEL